MFTVAENNIKKTKQHKLQSDVPIDLLDVEKNSAVVSYSQCDPEVSGEKTFSQIKRNQIMRDCRT